MSECNPISGTLRCQDALPSAEQSIPVQVEGQEEQASVVSARRLTDFDYTEVPRCPPERTAPDPTENCSDTGYGGPLLTTSTDDGSYDLFCGPYYTTDICYDEEVDIYLDYLPQTSDSPSEAPAARATASILLAAAAEPTSKGGTDPPADAMTQADPLIRGGSIGRGPPGVAPASSAAVSPELPTSDQLLIEMETGAGTGIPGDVEEVSRRTVAPEPSGALPSPGVALLLNLTLPAMVLE